MTVGGQADILNAAYPRYGRDQATNVLSDQGLAAGQPDLPHTAIRGDAHDPYDLFIGQDSRMAERSDARGGHTIDTSEITAVGYRYPQIIDTARRIIGDAAHETPIPRQEAV
jgi:hypothetical protein